MAPQTITANDGFTLVYELHGQGPALLLLHGFSHDHSLWESSGWIGLLSEFYTVLTVDLRGCGASTASINPADYHLDQHLDDIRLILQACGYDSIRLFGWSFGGTLGLHLATRLPSVIKAVIAGTTLGRVFTEQRILPEIAYLSRLHTAQMNGQLEEIALSQGWRSFLDRTDLPVYVARLIGCMTWPAIHLHDLTAPLLLYTGTADAHVVDSILAQRSSLNDAGVAVHIFDGLSHRDLIESVGHVAPTVIEFLASS